MTKAFSFAAAGLALLFVCLTGAARAQDYVYAIGNPSFSVDIPIENGYINVANGNIHLEIPISKVPQRGSLQHSSRLVYDSRIWKIIEDSSGNYSWQPVNVPNSMAGWRYVDGNDVGSVAWEVVNSTSSGCSEWASWTVDTLGKFTYTDPSGTVHPFDGELADTLPNGSCPNNNFTNSTSMVATDASGYYLAVTVTNGNVSATVSDNNGNEVYPQQIDRNGNYTSYDASGNPINTSGDTPVIISTSGNVTTYSVLAEGGRRVNYVVTTEPVNYNTAFNQSGVNDTAGSMIAIQSIQLPDGSKYSFTYDSSTYSGAYGELTSMTLPTGGTTTFQYINYSDSFSDENRWIFNTFRDGSGNEIGFSAAVITHCVQSGGTGCEEQMTVSGIQGTTVYTFFLNNGAWNTETDFWNGTPVAGQHGIMTTVPAYNFSYSCPGTECIGAENVTNTTESVTLWDAPGGPISSVDSYVYNTSTGKPVSEWEWDYAPGAPNFSTTPPTPAQAGGVSRQWIYTYGCCVNNAQFLTQVTQRLSGVPFTQTTYSYDQNPLLPSGATYLQPVSGQRGNITSIVQGMGESISGDVTRTTTYFTYDDAGMKRSMTDPNGNTTTYNYACDDTFLAQKTYPNGQTEGVNPDCSSGKPISKTDQNGQVTSYGYDALGRKSLITYPDGGTTSYGYPSSSQITTTRSISASVFSTSTTAWDGYGRKSTVTTSDPSGNDTVAYTYGNNLSSKCVSNPQRSTPSSTDGTTCYSMDILGRITGVIQPDGKTIGVVYLGNQATVTDENGHQKQYTYDAFHDLTSVLEPNASGALAWPTTYTYDGASHVTGINQVGDGSGARVRTFAYDSLGRMIQQMTPESGTTTYGYDGDGNLKVKTDGRGITTNYNYDQLNRLTSKTYANDSSGTASSCYQYDQSSVPGSMSGVAGDMLGRLSNEWTQAGACPASPGSGVLTRRSVLAYDAMGRVLNEQQCTPANCTTGAPFTPTYSYDLAGDIQSSTNGTGLVSFSNTYDAAGHLSTLTSSWNDATHPPALFSAPSYTPAGALTSATFGAGLNLSRTYDSRQRITNEADTGAAVQ